jgi:hypothetical protein
MTASRRVWRTPVLAVVGVALAGAVAIDRDRPVASEVAFGAPPAAPMPVAPAADVLTSTFYCPGVPSQPDRESGARTGAITILNPGDVPVSGTLTAYPSNSFEQVPAGQALPPDPAPGTAATQSITVPPRQRLVIPVPVEGLAASDYTAALVEMRGGDVVVEQASITASGTRPTPCATTASDTWYTADGSTTTDADLRFLAFNPFPEDAIVDFTFATDEGTREPQALRGYVIPARSLRAVRLTDEVLRKATISASVVTRSGRVVLGRFQTFDNSAGRQGVITGLAAPAAGRDWFFADGEKGEGVSERFAIFNPSDEDAEVTVLLYAGEGAAAIDPINDTVPPKSTRIINITEAATVPDGRHLAIVTSENGVPIVVERVLDTDAEGRRGTTSVFGARLFSTQWYLAAGAGDDATEYLTVGNPTGEATTFAVKAIGPAGATPVGGLEAVALGPAGTTQLNLSDLGLRNAALVIEGAGPIIAERSFYTPERAGATAIMGVPVVEPG